MKCSASYDAEAASVVVLIILRRVKSVEHCQHSRSAAFVQRSKLRVVSTLATFGEGLSCINNVFLTVMMTGERMRGPRSTFVPTASTSPVSRVTWNQTRDMTRDTITTHKIMPDRCIACDVPFPAQANGTMTEFKSTARSRDRNQLLCRYNNPT